jgi:heme-binding NEAT domain protein
MKYFSASLIALAFATAGVQAHAQHAAAPSLDQGAAAPAQPDTAAPPATPPAPTPDSNAPPAPDAGTPAPAAAPGTGATAATSVQVSDAEVDQFAKATVKVQKINDDAKLDTSAKQTKMAAAVKDAGLDPARYNEIAQAIPNDDALRSKVQVAMAKYAKTSPTKG